MCCFDSGTTFVNGTWSPMRQACCGSVPSRTLERDDHGIADPGDDAGGRVKLEGCGPDRGALPDRRQTDRPRPCLLGGLPARRGRPSSAVARERPPGRQHRASGSLTTHRRRRERPDHRRGDHRHRAARRSPRRTPSLERLVAPGQPEAVRKKVTFWLGNARGRRGFEALRRVIARRSEHRGPEERDFRPVAEPRAGDVRHARRRRSLRQRAASAQRSHVLARPEGGPEGRGGDHRAASSRIRTPR